MILEAAILIAWLVVLGRYAPLRALLRDAPRRPVVTLAALLLLWTYVQLSNDTVRFFPLVSWPMYGEPQRQDEVRSFAIAGVGCDGRRRRWGPADLIPGHPLRIRVQFLGAWHDRARTAADSVTRGALLDSTLVALGVIRNGRNPQDPWCAVELDRITVARGEARSGVIPPAEAVRHVDLR